MSLLHVAPAFAADDKPHHSGAYAETLGDVLLGVSFCDAQTNLAYIGIGELCPTVPRAECVPTFSDHVGGVIRIGAKKQMVWVDTGWRVAAVAYAHPRRHLTDEEDVSHAVHAFRLQVRSFAGSEGSVSIIKLTAGPKETAVSRGCPGKEPEHGVGAVMIASSQVGLQSGSLVRPDCDVSGIAPGRIYSILGG